MLGFPLLGGRGVFDTVFSSACAYIIYVYYYILYNNTQLQRSYFESCLRFSRKGFPPCRKSTVSSARGAPPRHGKQNVLINTHPSAGGAHIIIYRRDRRRRAYKIIVAVLSFGGLHCCLTSLLVINDGMPCDIILYVL